MTEGTRLIERWLPITEIGIESLRERTPMTPFPAPNRLHVWWARRPLVASRAAILASLLPADADRGRFKHALGIHGDPAASRRRIEQARRTGVRFEGQAYTYDRAFQYWPSNDDREWFRSVARLSELSRVVVLDPTAGGGAIPLEAVRLGLSAIGNDLNPVASVIQHATVEWPSRFGMELHREFLRLGERFVDMREQRLKEFYPPEPETHAYTTNYLWARTIRCPYCEGLLPLAPNWRLAPDGTGVRLMPRYAENVANRKCNFAVVNKLADQSIATVTGGDAICPFSDCGRVIDGEEVKRQAQIGQMGEQLYAIVFRRRVLTRAKSGKDKVSWVRAYRAPREEDDNSAEIAVRLTEKLLEWEALDFVPNERLPMETESWTHGNTPAQYGASDFRALFSARQLLCHGTSVEVFRELLAEAENRGELSPIRRAAFVYLTLSLDRLIDYNSRQVAWHPAREVIDHTFRQHAFPLKWSYAEMAPLVQGIGYDWSIRQTAKCIKELVQLARPPEAREAASELELSSRAWIAPHITLSCKSGDALDHVVDQSVDCVVMDPPYYDNVMYAELSDFFYVWLKRTAGHVLPELFRRPLTEKENEAVANPAKFRDQKGAKALAARDYQERMAAIFAECRRVLKPDGIMTLMFTHKATGAWDALTKGLMEAGFIVTASWPINTEAEGSLHIKDKAAANSTIFLACRPRPVTVSADTKYWEEVEPLVAQAVRKRVGEFQAAGIKGVDLYLASFGPALEEFSRHWPLRRGTPKPESKTRRKVQRELLAESSDRYEASPEDALDAARREVKSWRLEQLTRKKSQVELDPRTSWFVLAWDAFQAPVFPYDEALRLARAVGADLDADLVGSLCEKKGSDLLLWDSGQRAAKSALGVADRVRGMIDALHHAAYQARTRTLEAARELLERVGLLNDAAFLTALQAMLEVLPVGNTFSGIHLEGDLAGAGSDFDALEKLRRLCFTSRVDAPKQLELWNQEV